MGISLGWVVFFAAGATAAPPADRSAVQITYTVRMIEADGVGWREAVFTRLRPVARQGAATIWTLPEGDSTKLRYQILGTPSGKEILDPRVIAFAGMPATIQVRENQTFVTQVAWNADEKTPHGAPQDMRVGWHTTLIGRKLDQGILVKMVLEDTKVLAVHKVSVNSSTASHGANLDPDRATCATPYESTRPFVDQEVALDCAYSCHDAKSTVGQECIEKASSAYADSKPVDCGSLAKMAMQLDPHELAASMLSFKTKDKSARSAAHPRLDDTVKPVAGTTICRQPSLSSTEGIGNTIELPEIANQEVLGEWLIPNGECLLVSFGPHTVAHKDGKAVVRERLAIVEAEETTVTAPSSAAPFHFIPAPSPTIAPPAASAPLDAPAPNSMPEMPVEIERTPVPSRNYPTKASEPRLPVPAPPSRSFPEGIHRDGSKAQLPPLPDDEMEAEAAESQSSEPLPSPQTKKSRKPKPEPASDTGATKASFTQPRSSTVFLPSVFLPGASVGFQFLLPIKPLSLRLPFNQRLEIEIFGRVVPDTRASHNSK